MCASPYPGRRAPTRAGETEARGRNSARLAPAGARLPEDSFLSFAGDPAKVRTERPTGNERTIKVNATHQRKNESAGVRNPWALVNGGGGDGIQASNDGGKSRLLVSNEDTVETASRRSMMTASCFQAPFGSSCFSRCLCNTCRSGCARSNEPRLDRAVTIGKHRRYSAVRTQTQTNNDAVPRRTASISAFASSLRLSGTTSRRVRYRWIGRTFRWSPSSPSPPQRHPSRLYPIPILIAAYLSRCNSLS